MKRPKVDSEPVVDQRKHREVVLWLAATESWIREHTSRLDDCRACIKFAIQAQRFARLQLRQARRIQVENGIQAQIILKQIANCRRDRDRYLASLVGGKPKVRKEIDQ